ncbi:pirin-like C-terminal cupin domain-containing protein [uncultured Corynebacterium sp.]|uniref:pirin-like C-terminal cupin domain-containing protein n=1 Tax=uncultured Corynebacterium sp. TaxID=159447 RepID=UPI0025975FDF|nr:pirin-like C-terminal cupin domain-containing protein [uncultured Corynebacterium sp.]
MSSQYSAVGVILPREVPLGGPMAMTVHRTIPHRQRPMIGAQLHIAPGAEVELAVEASFEHGLLVDAAGIRLENVELPEHAIGYMGVGETAMRIENTSDEWVYALLIGGEPFGEEIVMWWNFVGRDFEEIKQARAEWKPRLNPGPVARG